MNSSIDSVKAFYDAMAADYHLIFTDWEQSIMWQGQVIDRLIRAMLTPRPEPVRVLDCACGIGTQAIGLVKQGNGRYQIHATDISPQEIERAKREAQKLNIDDTALTFGMADMRSMSEQIEGQFDIVLAFDNAIPHLLTDADLQIAANEIRAKTRPDGIFMASMRDYDALILDRPQATSHRVVEAPQGKRVTFQVWDWDEDLYNFTQFIITSDGTDWQMHHYTTRYRALQRSSVEAALQNAGFRQVRWLMPGDSDYYQPIVIALP